MTSRDKVVRRSGGCCEAMVEVSDGIFTRCWKSPIEVHHMLTRARGGKALDDLGEIYHLIALCSGCHRLADGREAYEGSLLIEGYVVRNKDGSVTYFGTDEYLKEKYGTVS